MTRSPQLLYPRAGEVGKTYHGAAFCAGEGALLDHYYAMTEAAQLDLADVRKAVQAGEEISVALEGIAFRANHTAAVRNCLARISAGQCLAYPLSD